MHQGNFLEAKYFAECSIERPSAPLRGIKW